MSNTKISYITGWVCLAIVLAYATYLFGITGLRTIAGMIIIFVLPVFMILNGLKNFGLGVLDTGEKLFFSLFIGLSLFTLFVWYIDRVIPSLRASLIAGVVVLALAGFLIKRYGDRTGRCREHQEAKEAKYNEN